MAKDKSNGAPAPEITPEQPKPAASAPQTQKLVLLKKLVAKNIVPRKDLVFKKVVRKGADGKPIPDGKGGELMDVENPEPRELYRVFGVASGTKTGNSDFGPWVSFTGNFEAVRFSDHTRFQSDVCFLQDPAEGMLLVALAEAQKADPGATLSFAFDVGVKPSQRWIDTDQGNSYEYTIASNLKTAKNDPLAELRGQVLGDLPALPAPSAS